MPDERFIAVTYPALYRAMRQLVSDSLEIVKHKFGDPPQWPQDSFREVTFSPPGGTNTSVVLRPYPTQGLSTAWAEVKTLPSFETTQTELKRLEAEGKAVGHWSGDLVAAYAFPILERYIHTGLPLLFQEEGFARCYEEIESYLSASSLSARIFLQLRGLQGSLNSVQLDTDHRLFQIDEETARRLWIRSSYAKLPVSQSTNLFLGVMQNANPLLPGHFALEVKFRYPKERIREMSLLLKGQIDSSSTALRLSHPGSGFIRFHSYEHIGFFPETGIYGFMEDPNYNQFAYTIDAGVAERFQRRWPDSLLIANLFEGASADLSNHLRVAIQRLNASCDKKIAADKLLDFMIAVEALVSRERDAVSYRVALRVATLVGKDAADRQAVFEVVNSAYEERSNIAHGRPGKLTSSDAEARAFLSKIEDILARTIHFFIQAEIAKKKKEDVLRLIDATIATQDRRTLEVTLMSKY